MREKWPIDQLLSVTKYQFLANTDFFFEMQTARETANRQMLRIEQTLSERTPNNI